MSSSRFAPVMLSMLLASSCAEATSDEPCESDRECGLGFYCGTSTSTTGATTSTLSSSSTRTAQRKTCSEICDEALCRAQSGSPRFSCRTVSGPCVEVDCSQTVPCLESRQICDRFAARCFAQDGRCTTIDECPSYDYADPESAGLSCMDGFCRWTTPEQSTIARPEGVESIAPLEFRPGITFDTEEAFRLSWEPFGEGSILAFVLDQPVVDLGSVPGEAIWGLAVPVGDSGAQWSDGFAVDGGVSVGPAGPAPRNAPLYLSLQWYVRGVLKGQSDLILFSFGKAFAEPGDTCDPDQLDSASCPSSGRVLRCSRGRCRAVCGSDADCLPDRPDRGVCDVNPSGGVRYCVL